MWWRKAISSAEETPTLADDALNGRGEIALYMYGSDTPEMRRRVSALLHEVPVDRRIPFYKCGGVPTSRKSWLNEYTRRQARNLPAV